MTLEEFRIDSLRTMADRREQEDAERDRRDRDYQALLASVIEAVKGRLGTVGPTDVSDFLDHVSLFGDPPEEKLLRGYPAAWTPCDFKIEAPNLSEIRFVAASRGTPDTPLELVEIFVGGVSFKKDWIEAVAAASTAPGSSK